jgi:hypothetical protein
MQHAWLHPHPCLLSLTATSQTACHCPGPALQPMSVRIHMWLVFSTTHRTNYSAAQTLGLRRQLHARTYLSHHNRRPNFAVLGEINAEVLLLSVSHLQRTRKRREGVGLLSRVSVGAEVSKASRDHFKKPMHGQQSLTVPWLSAICLWSCD